jgi:hypothetical protein
MAVLTQQQRNTLESLVKQARRLAESGARNALHALAVNYPEPFSHMKPDQRSLRNRLRSKARLLGDVLPSSGHQQIDHLAYELAYEYWHKILFAKFLEVNGLLMHPDGVAVTIEECEELAKDEGYDDKWDAAAGYASKMLPAIFRPEDPLMQVIFSPNDRIKLEEIIDEIDEYTFKSEDALGWVYQFWQSEAKEAINKSGDKIDGEKLPAVTQLFTEPYMVQFLIDNTVGAWWVNRNPGVNSPINFKYLRLLDDEKPAAGSFEGWPDMTADITVLDPCMGSGHFIVSLFSVFVHLRMYEEELSIEEATDKVISENLHGLELDQRCTQIAAFNLALTAWKFCGKYKKLPDMNLACSGLSPKGKAEDWIKLVGSNDDLVQKARLENGMRELYTLFQMAPEIGSLIDPSLVKADAFTASFEDLFPFLNQALEIETDRDIIERGVIAAGIAKAGIILSNKYNFIVTNFPFLGGNRMSDNQFLFCKQNYPNSLNELATVFFERSLKLLKHSGNISAVTPHYWLRLRTSKDFRAIILNNRSIKIIVDLGSGAFSNISGEVVKVCLIILNKEFYENNVVHAIDLNMTKSVDAKIQEIFTREFLMIEQSLFRKRKSGIIALSTSDTNYTLGDYANVYKGLDRADVNRFIFAFSEINYSPSRFKFIQTSFKKADPINGKTNVIDWKQYIEYSKNNPVAIRGEHAWKKQGVIVTHTGRLPVTKYFGELYDTNVHAIIPKKNLELPKIWNYCYSEEFNNIVRKYDTKIGVTNSVFEKIPFDISKEYSQLPNYKDYNQIKPITDDPTQWLFHGHPIRSLKPLQVSIARFLGFRWPLEYDKSIGTIEETQALIDEVKLYDYLTDNDGIICIPSVNAEDTAATRIRDYLKKIIGKKWNNNSTQELLKKEEAKTNILDRWLRNELFEMHCKTFFNRPFVWQIWDGNNDGFSALVNYHKLSKENLSKLIYTYLGDWIRMCELKKKNHESGAEGLLGAALKLKEKLELILEGEAPYDIFVRWKPIEQQPIGWDPDLNDGVRLNIRPFIEADVLRKRPNIKYGVDRGKNPPGSPWGEKRDNDIHLTLAEKIAAREKVKKDNGR